jgi:hypothetical protein
VPLISVEALPQPPGVDPGRVLAVLNEAVAEAIPAPATAVWSTWRTIEPEQYAVGADRPATQPAGSHPPLVRIFVARPPEVVERVEAAVERVLTRELGLAEGNVFVRLEARA